MKTAIIVILVILIAFSGGLLIYGSTLSAGKGGPEDLGDLLPPEDPDIYAHGISEWIKEHADTWGNRVYMDSFSNNPGKDAAVFAAEVDGWFDVFGKHDPATSIPTRYKDDPAGMVANLIVPITYNHNRAKQYCMVQNTVISAETQTVYSDNLRVRRQVAPFAVDSFYRARVWAGSTSASSVVFHVWYGTQRFDMTGLMAVQDYNEDTGVYTYSIGTPSQKSASRELDREYPYKTWDMLCLPIYFGGVNDSDPVVDSSVVDGSTVVLTEPTEEKPYYVLTFSEELTAAQREENTEKRLNSVLGNRMSNITIKKADFEAEIWDCGLLRQVKAHFTVNAKIGGKQGDAEVEFSYLFYYDDYACDVVRLIGDIGWEKYLNAENRADFNSRKKEYPNK